MKKITYILLLLFAFNFSYGQTTLAPGDIAITGFNADNPDEFSFVLLTDVANTTTINFTDNGWQSSGSFRTGEGVLTWTANSNLSCGTEVIITDNSPFTTPVGNITDSGSFQLSVDGDQILAYQGTLASPTFLAAVHFATSTPTGWTNATSSNTSAIPSGLTDGVDAIYVGNFDNAKYDCSVTINTPYILAAVNDISNWNGSNPSRYMLTNCGFTCSPCLSTVTWNGSWSGARDLTTEVIIASNYSTIAGFQACSLTVNAGVTLTVNDNSYIEVKHSVVVNGNLVVESSGNFKQNDDLGTFTMNGLSRVNKTTATKQDWFYYTYWSSPVVGETIADAFPNTDGDRRFWFNAANYLDQGGNDIDDNGDDWTIAAGTDIMQPGVGYAATAGRFHIPGATDIADFEGPFNTGDISTGISNNALNIAGSWNFIGNPYPGAIDFDTFHTANNTVVEGAAYFWSQWSPPVNANQGNQQNNFSLNDYATYTVGSGGVAGASGVIPTQYVPSGQGFFIRGLANSPVTFTNAMRMADATSNTQFYRSSNSKNKTISFANRLWVNLTSDNGVFNQILVAYVDGATNGNDGSSYDAKRLLTGDFPAALYSTIENSDKKFAIQGKAINSLTEDEIVKLGFATNINIATLYTLSIAQLQGDFLNNNTVYLKDNLLSSLHDLSTSDYTFTSETGEFNDRFEIAFSANALSTEDISANANTLKIIELEGDHVQFTASKAINSVRIFDLLGRQLYQFEGRNTSETYKLSNLSSAIYIAKIELSNGAILTKKAFKK